jgi:hypothetical protein
MQDDIKIPPIRDRARRPRRNFEHALGAHDELVVPNPHVEFPASQRAHACPGRVGGETMVSARRDRESLEADGWRHLDGVVGVEIAGGEC